MEREVFLFFHKTLASGFLDTIMVFFTTKGWTLWLPIFFWMIFKFFKLREYKYIIYIIFALIVGLFISDWISLEIKNITQRIRPCWTDYFRSIVGCGIHYSFPSGHATQAFTVALILILFLKKIKSLTLINFYIISVAIFTGVSRIYLGVHWPSDVLGGILLGLFFGFIVFKAVTTVNSMKRFFYFSLIIISLFRIYFILHGPLDLSPDEAHYWEWSRRIDLSYYSKGPMIAYLIAFSTWIFGDNPFGVRALAVVCSFLSSIFVYKLSKKLFDEKTGYLSGIFFQLIPLFSTFGVIFTIDSPFILFWIVSMYLFLLAIDGKHFYWIPLGLFIGSGLLTKYTMAFFYLCMLFYLLKEKNFRNPYLYLCIFISFIVFLPVIIWNFQHNWVTLKHTAGQAHLYDGFKVSLKYFIEFIGSQLAVVTPLVFILGIYFILKPSVLSLKSHYRWFLISFSMPVFIFFLLKSIQGKVQANWAMPAYIAFVIFIAYAFKEKIYKKLIFSAIAIAILFTLANHALPYLNLPVKFDPSAKLKGWKEIGVKVSEVKKELKKDADIVIFSDRYQLSSELAFYVKGKPDVYCISLGRRMNQYDLWSSINDELKSTEKPIHGIYVVYGIKQTPQREVLEAFQICEPQLFTVTRKNVKIRDYTIFKCYNFKGIALPQPESY